jgi:hypothetical protein
MATRKAISQKTRFEVFKRDGFKCMYCGAHPPGVLLHVDHVIAVAEGGANDMGNLVTSCDVCNQGKGARALTSVPQSLELQAAQVAEREEQLRGYAKVMEARRRRLEKETWEVMFVMRPAENSVPRDEMQSVKRFIEKLGYHEVLEAAEIAMAAPISYRKTFKYFCGICWNKLRKIDENPLNGIDMPWEKGGRG